MEPAERELQQEARAKKKRMLIPFFRDVLFYCKYHILKPRKLTLPFVGSSSARPGDELKVEQGVKDLRSLSLPNMKPSMGEQSPYILTLCSERVEHGSLGRKESNVDLLVSAASTVCSHSHTTPNRLSLFLSRSLSLSH